ncbi:sensor domain-containing protein [Paraburkholderia ferrariae]|uniref:sensor domain-containing protein n=1 Tax=Paraburkholderia ferrariae TaxID=386056 RepID=UPI000484C42F|nr:GGDEF domain-containing phosphodiesterase [Paraburkholderia ferrariae]
MPSHSLYESAFLAGPYGAFLCDAEGLFTHVNPAYEQLTGFSSEELVGKLTCVALHDPAELLRRIAPSRDGVSIESLARQRTEWTYVRRNGTRVPVSFQLALLPAASARPARPDAAPVPRYVGVAVDMSRHAHTEARLWYVSYHDPITQLPNRELLVERLELALSRSRRDEKPLTVCVAEIDDLDLTRAAVGPEGADLVLALAGERLRRLAGGEAAVGMIGGDQFAMVFPGGESQVGDLAARLHAGHEENGQLAGGVGHAEGERGAWPPVSLSIGAASWPQDGNDAALLIRRAGVALSEARRAGKGQLCRFSLALERRATRTLDLEKGLRRALNTSQLFLHYQPRVSLRTGGVSRSEALLRWRHPELGLVSPVEFIPVAEQTGMIHALGDWVMATACRETSYAQRLTGVLPHVAVNVSARQFANPRLVATIEAALQKAALVPSQLEIEITESVLIGDAERTVSTLQALRASGIEVAVDDFGTGYSSLAYLARLPINRLKIDRAFVMRMTGDPRSAALVQAIVSMAHGLGLAVTAEGVETAEQAEALREMGCDEAQGYWFSRPITLKALCNLLEPAMLRASR